MVDFNNGSEASVIVMAVRLSPRVRKRVEERIRAGKCLHCDEASYRRGLCMTHYWQWRSAMLDTPKRERPAREAKLIESGRLAENRQGKKPGIVNLFREIAG